MIFRLITPLVRSVIRTDLLKGFSRNKVWNMLPSHNLPKFHKQTFWKVATQLLGEIQKEPLVQAYPSSWPLSHDIMVEGDFPTIRKYWLKGEMTLYDPETDKLLTQPMQWYSDANLGKDGWVSQFMKQYTPGYDEQDLELVGADINLVIHQAGAPY